MYTVAVVKRRISPARRPASERPLWIVIHTRVPNVALNIEIKTNLYGTKSVERKVADDEGCARKKLHTPFPPDTEFVGTGRLVL